MILKKWLKLFSFPAPRPKPGISLIPGMRTALGQEVVSPWEGLAARRRDMGWNFRK